MPNSALVEGAGPPITKPNLPTPHYVQETRGESRADTWTLWNRVPVSSLPWKVTTNPLRDSETMTEAKTGRQAALQVPSS